MIKSNGELTFEEQEEKARQAEARKKKLEELREKAKKEMPKYVRVGCKYYKEIHRPDKSGQTIKTYSEWQKGTIIDDFGKHNIDLIKAYEGFCIVPSHTNFEAVINGFFNEYSEISHIPKNGKCDNILNVVKHIFGKNYFDFALDYLKLLYEKPTQRLPIILLESDEKNTGKSTFGTLLKLIFEDNAIKLGNTDIESDFNSFWLKRLCIIVDETSLEKKGIMQMLKRLSTETSTVTSNEKNKAQTQIDFYGKFFFMSNDESKALPIEKGDTRFAVFKVPTFSKNGINEIPNLEEILRLEIPAFLDFLMNRKMVYENESRMYFKKEVYETPQLLLYFKNSLSYVGKAIKEMMIDYFNFFDDRVEIKLSLANVLFELRNGSYLKSCDKQQIKKALFELGFEEQNKQRYDYFSLYQNQNNQLEININNDTYFQQKQNNRIFIFNKNNFEA